MTKIEGNVKATSDKNGKYGLNIDDVWYNGFGKPPANKGDKVSVDFEINGAFKNVNKVTILEATPVQKTGIDLNAELRRKTDCILEGSQTFRDGKIKREEIIDYARGLYRGLQELENFE